MDNLLVYGAYGYTGDLIVREAVSRGGSPVVAGRNRDRVAALARDLDLEGRAFDLDPEAGKSALADRLAGFDAVCNCAGPFEDTAEPLVEACLEAGVDYLDITGEVPVFERLAARDDRATDREVTVLPGVGFDVVPSDCLAAHLHDELPTATRLAIGIDGFTTPSCGTARTVLRTIGEGSVVRRDGRLVRVPMGTVTREIDFGDGPKPSVAVTLGDVSTAYRSTGIETIEVYLAVPRPIHRAIRVADPVTRILSTGPVRSALDRLLPKTLSGPSVEERANDETTVWGEVTDGDERVRARLRTPNAYTLTADAAVSAAERVLAGEAPVGFQTPSTAFGADFPLQLAGVERERLPPTDSSERCRSR